MTTHLTCDALINGQQEKVQPIVMSPVEGGHDVSQYSGVLATCTAAGCHRRPAGRLGRGPVQFNTLAHLGCHRVDISTLQGCQQHCSSPEAPMATFSPLLKSLFETMVS